MLKFFYNIIHNLIYIFLLTLSIFSILSCGTTKYVYLPGETKIEYRDSIVYKDSIEYRPVEVIKEIVPELDTLKMETSIAKAEAYIDTTNKVLRGKIENKKGISTKIEYREKIVYRDSIVTKPVPVEVTKEVKTHYWYEKILWFFSLIGLGTIIIFIIKIYVPKKG